MTSNIFEEVWEGLAGIDCINKSSAEDFECTKDYPCDVCVEKHHDKVRQKISQEVLQEGDNASGCILMNLVGEKGMDFATLKKAIDEVHKRFEELKKETE